jgi:hypothetical protein
MVQPPQRHGQGGSPPMMLGYSQPHASCVPVAGRRMFTITHTDLAADMLQQLPRTEGIHWDGTGEPFSKANESAGRGSDHAGSRDEEAGAHSGHSPGRRARDRKRDVSASPMRSFA